MGSTSNYGGPVYPVDIRQFGCKSHEAYANFDNTTAWASAVASGENLFIPSGTFYNSGLATRTGLFITGGGKESVLKLLPNTAQHVLQFQDTSYFHLFNFTVDGNKANQTPGQANSRGVYVLGASYNWLIDRLWIDNTLDHGISISTTADAECGKDSVITRCISNGVGSAAHLGAGGAGGTAFAAGGNRIMLAHNRAYGAYLNGFKTVMGTLIDCDSVQCGGGFESGSASPVYYDTTYLGCRAISCTAGGWRHQGQGHRIAHIGCRAINNGQSGIMFLGSFDHGLVDGCDIRNNGQAAPVRDIANGVGKEGVSIYANASTPARVVITNSFIGDDQGSPTQDYGVMVSADVGYDVLISPSNSMTGNLTGSHYVSSTARPRIMSFNGHGAQYRSESTVTVTGTTSTTDLMSMTIPANQLTVGSKVDFEMYGTVSGASNSKTIRLVVGASSQSFYSGNFGDDWYVKGTIEVMPGGKWLVTGKSGRVASVAQVDLIMVPALSVGSSANVKCTTTLTSGSDTVAQNFMSMAVVQ